MKELHSTAKANKTHTHAQSDITNLSTTLAAKAPLASPSLTGTPTAPTAAAGTKTTQIATTAFVDTAVNNGVKDKQNKVVTDSDGNAVKSMVLVTDANGNIVGSTYVNTTELNMLNNIRSNVQTQIDDITAGICIPDYSSETDISPNTTHTFAANGLLVCNYHGQSSNSSKLGRMLVNLDGVRVADLRAPLDSSNGMSFVVGKGSVLTTQTGYYPSGESAFQQDTSSDFNNAFIKFYPYK